VRSKLTKKCRPRVGRRSAETAGSYNFLKGQHGDGANAVLAVAGSNFRRLLAWLAILWRVYVMAFLAAASHPARARLVDA
jgi:transposase, IS5 family